MPRSGFNLAQAKKRRKAKQAQPASSHLCSTPDTAYETASKLYISAKPNAKTNQVLRIDATHYRVSVKAPPDEGKANKAIIEVLHKYFGMPKSRISIVSGHKSKQKVVVIQE